MVPSANGMLRSGHIVDDTYRIEQLLGSDGMAQLYIVSHMRMPRRFILKILTVKERTDLMFSARFRHECEILASVHHPHIADVVDWNLTPGGFPYLVIEYLVPIQKP